MSAAPSLPSTLPDDKLVRWFRPNEGANEELVLSGPCGQAIEVLARELRHTERFVEAGLDPSTRILFSGPSGTGKTLAARWLGRAMRVPVGIVDVSGAVNCYIGETAKNVARVFEAASRAKAILFLDEIDAICKRRSGGSGTSASAEIERATTAFFQQIDWAPPAQIVIAATNFHDELDPALRRRLTTQVAFTLPDRPARRRMLELWLARAELAPSLLDELADASEGDSGAELRSRAMARARREFLRLNPAAGAPRPRRNELFEGSQRLLRVLEEAGKKEVP